MIELVGHAAQRRSSGMQQTRSVEIAATVERVWEVLVDVERWPEWTETVTSVRRLDDGPLRTGWRAKIKQPKVPENEYVVTELEPGRSFTWVASGPGARTTARHVLEPLPDGRTSARLSVQMDGWFGSIIGRIYRGMTERYLTKEAAGLKTRSEAATAASS